MKGIQSLPLACALITIFTSCQLSTSQQKQLSNKQERLEIMNTIAGDSLMSKEMLTIMMEHEGGTMMQHQQMGMMGDSLFMMNMLKNHPGMMNNMMSGMMGAAGSDTAMMRSMFNNMMRNPSMMNMMQHTNSQGMMNNMNQMHH